MNEGLEKLADQVRAAMPGVRIVTDDTFSWGPECGIAAEMLRGGRYRRHGIRFWSAALPPVAEIVHQLSVVMTSSGAPSYARDGRLRARG